MSPGGVVDILGCAVEALSVDSALDRATALVERSEPAHVVPVNAAKILRMRRDVELRHAVREADLVVADGASVVAASRWLGTPVPGRVAGIDLMELLLQRASEHGWSAWFLGGRPGVAERAARFCERRYGATIAGVQHGYFESAVEVVDHIRTAGPDLLFVGMGTPRQEIFLQRWLLRSGVRLGMGVGGSLDVLAGDLPRAPRWLREHGLEWAWRTAIEPRRIASRRTLDLGLFAARVARARATR